jgi:hypothetical protein
MRIGLPRDASRTRRSFEFQFASLDTLVQVENSSDGVIIRATRNTFSEARKISFIHELAAEGFVDDSFCAFSGFKTTSSVPIRWFVDRSWLKLDKNAVAQTNRFMIRLILSAVFLWLVMMAGLFIFSPG